MMIQNVVPTKLRVSGLSSAIVLSLMLTMAPATGLAQSPPVIPVQGHLANATGESLEGDVEVTFQLLVDAEGSAELWSDTLTVTCDGGYFSAYLGVNKPLDLAAFRDYPAVFLGIKVGTDPRMDPIELATVPWAAYATHCGDASTIEGSSVQALINEVELQIGDTTHARYTDDEALAAMGAAGDTNPLNHNRFSQSEAVAAMGGNAPTNPLNHERYTDDEARAAVAGAPISGDVELSGGSLVGAANVVAGQSYALDLRVTSRGYMASQVAAGVWVNGQQALGTGRSYGLTVIDRATGTVEHAQSYDVYGDVANAQALADQLATYDHTKIVIVNTNDEPQGNRTAGGLPDQIARCGGTQGFRHRLQRRSAYLLVGICDMGPGTGIELYSGDIADSPNAFLDTNVQIIDGNLPTTGSAGNTIVCSYADAAFMPAAGGNTHTFTAAECGGVLPDATYVGFMAKAQWCGSDEDWMVRQVGESGGPGMYWWMGTSCAGGAIQAVYIKR